FDAGQPRAFDHDEPAVLAEDALPQRLRGDLTLKVGEGDTIRRGEPGREPGGHGQPPVLHWVLSLVQHRAGLGDDGVEIAAFASAVALSNSLRWGVTSSPLGSAFNTLASWRSAPAPTARTWLRVTCLPKSTMSSDRWCSVTRAPS